MNMKCTIGIGVRYTGVTELARRCGCSKTYISLVLHGRQSPSPALRRKLVRQGVDVEAVGLHGRKFYQNLTPKERTQ